MRGLIIVAAVACALMAVDHYRFDGLYTGKVMEMGRSIVDGISR